MRHQGVSLLALLLTGLLITAGWTRIGEPNTLTLRSESKVWVEGTSTIHEWTCDVQKVTGSVVSETTGVVSVTGVNVQIPVEEIACKNGTMDKKTYEALKGKAHPVIEYKLDVSEVLPGSDENHFELRTKGHLEIAGVARPIEMTVSGQRLGDGRFKFSGETPLLMSDYDIDPPKAMLGTLKTGDRVVVHFEVVAENRDA